MAYTYHKDLTGADLHPPKFLTGLGAPTDTGGPTPSYIGQIYFATDEDMAYISNGTSNNANWQLLYDTISADARYWTRTTTQDNLTGTKSGTYSLTTYGTITLKNTYWGDEVYAVFTPGSGAGLKIYDGGDFSFGTGFMGTADVRVRWNTADTNANMLTWKLPTGDATNVPVVAFGLSGVEYSDLGLFNGYTVPTIQVLYLLMMITLLL